MARRERVRSACTRLQNTTVKNCNDNTEHKNTVLLSNNASIPLERSKSMISLLPIGGNNLAAILRCQVSRYYGLMCNIDKCIFLVAIR